MRKYIRSIFILCGWLLTLAAFPVFAQEKPMSKNQINKKPIKDFEKLIKKEIATGKLDLNKSFLIELEGVLNENGRLDLKKSRFVKSEGDAAMFNIAKSFVEAVGNSGWLIYLREFGIEKMNLMLRQNDSQTYAAVVSELPTSERAATIATGLNTMVRGAQMRETGARGINQDEKLLIGGIKAESADKILTIKLTYEKSAVRELINRLLNETGMKQSSEK